MFTQFNTDLISEIRNLVLILINVFLCFEFFKLAFKIARRASIIHDDKEADEGWEQMNIDCYFFCIKKLEMFTEWLERYPHDTKMRLRVEERMDEYERDLDYHRAQISPFSNAPVKHSPRKPYPNEMFL